MSLRFVSDAIFTFWRSTEQFRGICEICWNLIPQLGIFLTPSRHWDAIQDLAWNPNRDYMIFPLQKSNVIWHTCWDDFRDTERKWHSMKALIDRVTRSLNLRSLFEEPNSPPCCVCVFVESARVQPLQHMWDACCFLSPIGPSRRPDTKSREKAQHLWRCDTMWQGDKFGSLPGTFRKGGEPPRKECFGV